MWYPIAIGTSDKAKRRAIAIGDESGDESPATELISAHVPRYETAASSQHPSRPAVRSTIWLDASNGPTINETAASTRAQAGVPSRPSNMTVASTARTNAAREVETSRSA